MFVVDSDLRELRMKLVFGLLEQGHNGFDVIETAQLLEQYILTGKHPLQKTVNPRAYNSIGITDPDEPQKA